MVHYYFIMLVNFFANYFTVLLKIYFKYFFGCLVIIVTCFNSSNDFI